MTLSIITINWNNAAGLEKTLRSVADQTSRDFEHIIVDGASTDGSAEIIKAYAENAPYRVDWSSEPDKGIYNAMNKGIRRATGTYIQILNSGDCLYAPDVEEKMKKVEGRGETLQILYGNMVKMFADGHTLRDKCFAGQPITMLGMYTGTLNHDPAWIRRDLFDRFGLYDENLKIVSDWKWYLQVLVLGTASAKPLPVDEVKYVDVDVALFDMTGISESSDQTKTVRAERRSVLEELLPSGVLLDYDKYAADIYLMRRIRRHGLIYKTVWFLERILFKFEKKKNNREKRQIWG